MPIRFLVALGEKVCRMPVFPSRKRPNWHRWCNLFASFASFVDQLRVVLLECNKELAKAVRKQLHEIEKAQVTDSSVNLDQQVKQLKNRLSELLVQIQEREARTRGFVG